MHYSCTLLLFVGDDPLRGGARQKRRLVLPSTPGYESILGLEERGGADQTRPDAYSGASA